MASTNTIRIRAAGAYLGYNLDNWAWGVFSGGIMLAVVTVQLRELSEVCI